MIREFFLFKKENIGRKIRRRTANAAANQAQKDASNQLLETQRGSQPLRLVAQSL